MRVCDTGRRLVETSVCLSRLTSKIAGRSGSHALDTVGQLAPGCCTNRGVTVSAWPMGAG